MDSHSSSSDNGESEDSTLVSYPEDRSEWDSLSPSSQEALEAVFSPQWHEHEKEFQYRTKVLNKLKLDNDPLYEFLWQRELQVRNLQRQRFLQRFVAENLSNLDYNDYEWHELPTAIQNAAKVLGWNEVLWDKDKDPREGQKSWEDLSSAAKEAAGRLGYNEDKWATEFHKGKRHNKNKNDNGAICKQSTTATTIHETTTTTRDAAIPSIVSSSSDSNTVDDEEDLDDDDDSSSSDDDMFFDALVEHDANTLVECHIRGSLISADSPPILSRIGFDMKLLIHVFINLYLYVIAAICVDEILWCVKAQFLPRHFRKSAEGIHDSSVSCMICYIVQAFCGMVILRFSTRLLWFSTPLIYDCVKFDMHNGVRLGEDLPKLVLQIQKRNWLCWLVFMVGYNMVAESIYFYDELVVYKLFGYIESPVNIFLFDVVLMGVCLSALNRRGYSL